MRVRTCSPADNFDRVSNDVAHNADDDSRQDQLTKLSDYVGFDFYGRVFSGERAGLLQDLFGFYRNVGEYTGAAAASSRGRLEIRIEYVLPALDESPGTA